jgi:ubiquinone/menaquinone biosynthesis C-methylase UbiE
MGYHTFDIERAGALEDPSRFAYCSVEELVALVDPSEAATIADIGSGTGFYTDELAPFVDQVYAVDVQAEMHDIYREKGVPENVALMTAEAADLPVADGDLDGVFSTFTFHEFAAPAALTELTRALAPNGRVGIADWSADGAGAAGPPRAERFSASEATSMFEAAGCTVTAVSERRETFTLAARGPE